MKRILLIIIVILLLAGCATLRDIGNFWEMYQEQQRQMEQSERGGSHE